MTNCKRQLRRTAAIVLALSTIAAGSAQAQARRTRIAIAAQPMDRALEQLARQSGSDILFTPAAVARMRAPAVSGDLDAESAVRRLIAGKPLSVTRDASGALIVRPSGAAGQDGPPPPAATPTASDETAAESEIVVTGIVESLGKALDDKRRATNVVEVVRAEDIGKFPAQNIAEALQRVPGVSIVRDRGEGVFVRVRGLGSQFQVVTLNDRTVAVNENIRDSGQSGRQFRFDTLASELVSAVEVVKSPRASLDEGGIAGLVNLRTFRPLDLGKPTVALSATASYPELADKLNPRLSGMASWVNDGGTFGALMSAVYDERSTRQDRVILVGWTEASIDADGNGVREPGTVLVPQSARPTLEREDRARLGLTAAVQWKPDDRFQLNVDALWSRLDIAYDELAYSADFQNSGLRTIVPGSAVIEDGVLTKATVATSTQIGREVSELRYTNFLAGVNAAYTYGPLTIAADLTYGEARSDTPSPIYRARVLGPVGNVSFDYGLAGDRLPNLSFLTADLESPSLLPGRRLEYRVNDSQDRERASKLDLTYALGDTGLTAIRAGAKAQRRTREYNRRDINFTNGIAGVTLPAAAYNAFPVDGFLDGVDGSIPRSWLEPRTDYFIGAAIGRDALLAAPLARGDLRNSYAIEEEILAGYVMGEFDLPLGGVTVRGDLGVRYAHTKQTSSGYADNGRVAVPVRIERPYDNWLPALNLAVEFSDTLQSHFAVAKVITRPSLADLAPRLTINSNPTILTAVGGNPELRPFEAWQYDLTAEWYFAPASALIGGVFYKDITTFVYQQTRPFVLDGQTYALTAPENGGDAYVYGFELAYQHSFRALPAPFDGLGLLASYTHTESQGTYANSAGTFRDALVDVAKDNYSATLFYEKGPAAVRLSYAWRGDVLRDVGGAGLAANNDSPFGSLDFDISYDIRPNLTLSFQGINLTNDVQWNYVRDDRFAGYTDYGRTFWLGLRAKF